MILRTERLQITIELQGARFFMQELSTEDITEVAISGKNSPGAGVRLTFLKALIGWENVSTAKGKLLYSEDNKKIIFSSNPRFVEKLLELFHDEVEKAREEEKKSWMSGAGGTSNQTLEAAKIAKS